MKMKMKQIGKNKFRRQFWWEEHDTLCSSLVSLLMVVAFVATFFI